MTRLLVTGAAGFIGGHTCRRLLDAGHTVVGLDAFDAGYDAALHRAALAPLLRRPGFTFHEGDIRDAALLDRLLPGVDRVVHLAARAGVRQSLAVPTDYAAVNVVGTATLLHACARADVRGLTLASSSSVYGEASGTFDEADPAASPVSPYAASKRAAEWLASDWSRRRGVPVDLLRFFTVYGPGQPPRMAIHRFTRRLLRGEPIPVYGDGSSARDYTFVEDVAAAIEASVTTGDGLRTLNIGGAHPVTLLALIEALAGALGRPARLEHLPDQAGDVSRTAARIDRAREALGWTPTVGLDEGLARWAAWARPRLTP